MKILFYTSGKTGLGHLKRLLRVSSILNNHISPRYEILLISGMPFNKNFFQSPKCKILVLKDLFFYTSWGQKLFSKESKNFQSIKQISNKIEMIVNDFHPNVFITSHLLGIAGELLPVYPILKSIRCKIFLAWRDIIDDILMTENINQMLEEYFDRILVLGTQKTKDYLPIDQLPPKLKKNIFFSGYIYPIEYPKRKYQYLHKKTPSLSDLKIFCQVGGGFDGEDVAISCIKAVNWISNFCTGINVTLDLSMGPLMPKNSKKDIMKESNSHIKVFNWVNFSPQKMLKYDLQITMAGYNTCVESAYFAIPTIMIPRDYPGDQEQRIRAELFKQLFCNIFVSAHQYIIGFFR